MGQITVDQSHQVMAALATNTAWDEIDFVEAGLQDLVIRSPQEAGRQFTAFLKNGGRVIVGGRSIVPINRTAPFDPVKLLVLGNSWTIEEQDERSLAIVRLDLSKVQLVSGLREGERLIKGKERLSRLKSAGYIRLDAKVFQAFWENQILIPESWKQKTNGDTTFICFDGTILRSPNGNRYVLYLYWSVGRWYWNYRWLGYDWYVSHLSAVLASI